MYNSKRYEEIVDIAYKVLIKENLKELPIKVSDICKNNDILLCSYIKGYNIIKKLGIEDRLHNKGFSIYTSNKYIIFYDENQDRKLIRFIIAHELGHIFLNHFKIDYINENIHIIEEEANIFAISVLVPLYMLDKIHIKEFKDISKICDIPLNFLQFIKLKYNKNKINNNLKKYINNIKNLNQCYLFLFLEFLHQSKDYFLYQ